MADTTALKNRIRAAIKANDNQEITGPVLQQTLLDIVDELDLYPELQEAINTEKNARQNSDTQLQQNINNETQTRQSADTQLNNLITGIKNNIDNGYVYAGIATPSTNPVSGKVFYIAKVAGTYTNFSGLVLTQGINILRYYGSVWRNQQFIGIDDEPTAGSNNLVKSSGVMSNLFYTIPGYVLSKSELPLNSWHSLFKVKLKEGKKYIIKYSLDSVNPDYITYCYVKDSTFVEGTDSGVTLINMSIPKGDTSKTEIYTSPIDQVVNMVAYATRGKTITVQIAEEKPLVKTSEIEDEAVTLAKINQSAFDDTPTPNSNNLVKSSSVFKQLCSKEDVCKVDGVSIAEITADKYVGYSDGELHNTSSDALFKIYTFNIKQRPIKKVYCKVGASNSAPASIAFYTTSVASNKYLSSVSVQAVKGIKEYVAEIPLEATYMVITNRGDVLATPIIELIEDSVFDEFTIFERNEASVVTSNIATTIDLTNYPIGSQIKLRINELSGNSEPYVEVRDINNKIKCRYDYINELGRDYIFEVTEVIKKLYIRKNGVADNKFNFIVKVCNRPKIGNRLTPDYQFSKDRTITLGTPFQGYLDAEGSIHSSNIWVTFPIVKSNGYKIHINADFSVWYINISFWNNYFTSYVNTNITEEQDVEIKDCYGWCLSIKKVDGSNITPEDVAGVFSLTFVKGFVFKRPLLPDDEEIKNINGRLDSLENSKVGYKNGVVLSYLYHFSPNGFVIRGLGTNRGIPSQSLPDIEFAARLGFEFIECNVQRTSDGKYICTHGGSSNNFGNEFQSADTSIISDDDLRSTVISTVTLDWINQYVKYRSAIAKYNVAPPTLEQFCQACKANNIGILLSTNRKDAIETCMAILGSKNMIITTVNPDVRGYYDGLISLYENSASVTISSIENRAKSYGAPLIYSLGPTALAKLQNDEVVDDFISLMREKNYLAGWVGTYCTEEDGRYCIKKGFDVCISGHDVGLFSHNYEIYDLDINSSDITTTGVIENQTIALQSGETVSCGSSNRIIGKGCLTIKFNGSLTISFGSSGDTERTITSLGNEPIILSDYFFMHTTELLITANADTEITELVYKTSKV